VIGFYRAGLPGTRVGGDWYDVIELPDGSVALVIGDVMGCGVAAAALMGQLRAAIRALSRLGLAPGELLAHCDGLVPDLARRTTVTCVYAVIDATRRSLTWANAGHLPPLLVATGRRMRTLEFAAHPPLGTGLCRPEDLRADLSEGEVLVLYTDGLVERRGRPLEPGIERLGRAVSRWQVDGGSIGKFQAMLPDESDDDAALLLVTVVDQYTPVSAARAAASVPDGASH
jgi:serine phosphatase RsbU (regulator of sigma subunit)